MASAFKVGDLVWAKMKGFPPWPGVVTEPLDNKKLNEKKPKYYIFFFGSENYAWVTFDNMSLYLEKREEYVAMLRPTHSFQEAVDAIDDYVRERGGIIPVTPVKSPAKQSDNEEDKTASGRRSRKRHSTTVVVETPTKSRADNKQVKSAKKESVKKEKDEKMKIEGGKEVKEKVKEDAEKIREKVKEDGPKKEVKEKDGKNEIKEKDGKKEIKEKDGKKEAIKEKDGKKEAIKEKDGRKEAIKEKDGRKDDKLLKLKLKNLSGDDDEDDDGVELKSKRISRKRNNEEEEEEEEDGVEGVIEGGYDDDSPKKSQSDEKAREVIDEGGDDNDEKEGGGDDNDDNEEKEGGGDDNEEKEGAIDDDEKEGAVDDDEKEGGGDDDDEKEGEDEAVEKMLVDEETVKKINESKVVVEVEERKSVGGCGVGGGVGGDGGDGGKKDGEKIEESKKEKKEAVNKVSKKEAKSNGKVDSKETEQTKTQTKTQLTLSRGRSKEEDAVRRSVAAKRRTSASEKKTESSKKKAYLPDVLSSTTTTTTTKTPSRLNKKFTTIVPTQKKIGFVGCGSVGSRLVECLLASKHQVLLWNRTAIKCKELLRKGATKCTSPSDVVKKSDVIITCVSDAVAFKDVIYGSNGVLQAMKEGKALVNVTTVDVETTLDACEAITSRGGRFLEAAMLGSLETASKGDMLVLVAGDQGLFDDCSSLFKAISKNIFNLVDIGTATKMQVVFNSLYGTTIAGLAEGLSLASKVGIDPAEVLEVVSHTSVISPLIRTKGEAMVKNLLTNVDIRLDTLQRDIRLAINMSEEVDQPLHVGSVVNELFKKAKAKGYGDCDVAAVYRATDL